MSEYAPKPAEFNLENAKQVEVIEPVEIDSEKLAFMRETYAQNIEHFDQAELQAEHARFEELLAFVTEQQA